MTKIFKNQFALIILLIFLIIPTFWSLIRPGFFPMQDDLQAFRLFEMDKCFQDLQLPCRWIPDMGYQYGYPQFNFYSPGVFYLGWMFHLLGMQFIDVVKLLFVLGFILSAVVMFIFLRAILGNLAALVGSLLYSYLPFKAVEVYVRGSLSEFWALVIFPLLFWSSYQLITTQKKRYGFWLAASVGFMFLTHNLLSILIFPLLVVWCVVILGIEKRWILISWLIGFGFLGLGLASFFVLPVLFEKQFVHTETLLSGYFDYRQHFVPLEKIFLSNEWGYGSSNLGQTEDLNLSTGIVQWVVGLLGFILSIFFWHKDKKNSALVFVIGILTALSLFMVHQKSSFGWSLIPVLSWLQFPWRFLAISGFLLSILSAAAIYFLQKWSKISQVVAVIVVLTAISLTSSFYQPKDWLNISDQEKFSGTSWEKQLTISIFDYLPIYAMFPPNKKAPELPEVLVGNTQFQTYNKRSNFQQSTAKVTENSIIRLPLFDFPGMQVKVDGQVITHYHDDCRHQEFCLGLVTFDLPFGNHNIVTKLENTPIRTLGNLVTVGSLIIFGVGVFKKKLWKL